MDLDLEHKKARYKILTFPWACNDIFSQDTGWAFKIQAPSGAIQVVYIWQRKGGEKDMNLVLYDDVGSAEESLVLQETSPTYDKFGLINLCTLYNTKMGSASKDFGRITLIDGGVTYSCKE